MERQRKDDTRRRGGLCLQFFSANFYWYYYLRGPPNLGQFPVPISAKDAQTNWVAWFPHSESRVRGHYYNKSEWGGGGGGQLTTLWMSSDRERNCGTTTSSALGSCHWNEDRRAAEKEWVFSPFSSSSSSFPPPLPHPRFRKKREKVGEGKNESLSFSFLFRQVEKYSPDHNFVLTSGNHTLILRTWHFRMLIFLDFFYFVDIWLLSFPWIKWLRWGKNLQRLVRFVVHSRPKCLIMGIL